VSDPRCSPKNRKTFRSSAEGQKASGQAEASGCKEQSAQIREQLPASQPVEVLASLYS
jgi:hypothetical protein